MPEHGREPGPYANGDYSHFPETKFTVASVTAVARAMRYVADLVGVEHVALGSDFDGAVTTPMDATGLPLLTQALLDAGFTLEDVTQIMGGNVLRFLREALPKR